MHVLAPDAHPDHEPLHARGIPVHLVERADRAAGRPARYAPVVLQTAALLRAHAFELVHLNLATARLWGRLAALVARDVAVVSSIRGFESRYERATNWVDDVTVAVSDAVRRYLVAEGVAEHKLLTIPNGIAEAPADVDRAYLHRKLGLPSDVPLVGMVAYFRDHAQKGHGTFVDAACLLARRRPAVHFVIVGSSLSRRGFTREYFEAYVRDAGLGDRVHFLGERHDTLPIIGSLAAHVLPSRSEGCPMVMLEAMSMAVPNVASRLDSIAEIVEDGRSGLLVAPGDAAAVADALDRLLADPVAARAIGHAGRAQLAERFTAGRMAERYEAAYRVAVRTHMARAAARANATATSVIAECSPPS